MKLERVMQRSFCLAEVAAIVSIPERADVPLFRSAAIAVRRHPIWNRVGARSGFGRAVGTAGRKDAEIKTGAPGIDWIDDVSISKKLARQYARTRGHAANATSVD